MPIEIERKFLVQSDGWRASIFRQKDIIQGYLATSAPGHVRVRCMDGEATVTIKGPRQGLVRQEFEYPIALSDARYMLAELCGKPLIEKVRHWIEYDGVAWEVDVFKGFAAGLIVAEVELERVDQVVSLPPWVGEEVSGDWRFSNTALSRGAWKLRPPTLSRIETGLAANEQHGDAA